MSQLMKMCGSKKSTQHNMLMRKKLKKHLQNRKTFHTNDFHRFPKHLKEVA